MPGNIIRMGKFAYIKGETLKKVEPFTVVNPQIRLSKMPLPMKIYFFILGNISAGKYP